MSDKQTDNKREMPGIVLLWNYPEIWWRRRGFFSRLLLLVLVFALVGSISIAVYDSRVRDEHERLFGIQREMIGELSRLTSEVKNERAEVREVGESEVLMEIEKVKDELRDLQLSDGNASAGLLNTSVEEALAALEMAYPTTSSGLVEF